MKRLTFFSSTMRAAVVASVLALSPAAIVPAMAQEDYLLENEEDTGWFDRAVEAAGPEYGEAEEFEREDEFLLENEEDQGWFDRAVEAAGPEYEED